MKTGKNIITIAAIVIAAIATGITIGRHLFTPAGHSGEHSAAHKHTDGADTTDGAVWTCSMHPHIRQDHPGKCPLCAMDLVPLITNAPATASGYDIVLSGEAVALSDIRTLAVRRSKAIKEITLYGSIRPDERLARSEVAHTAGRIEKLFVNFTGETIEKGAKIASLYSPALLNARQELLEALRIQSSDPKGGHLLEAAREKLRLLKLTPAQIAGIEESGHISPLVDVMAQSGGIVTARKVSEGDYVGQGSVIFELIDLSTVWAMFDAYEADLPYLRTGDAVSYAVKALPGERYSGRIAFIDPSIDPVTRTAKVRVETSNAAARLKPGMYAEARIEAAAAGSGESITVPKTAILWTGKRSIVYIRDREQGAPTFTMREVDLGASLGNDYIILSGIDEGEEVVISGTFAIDAAAQLEGKPSMMGNGAISGSIATEAASKATFAVSGLCEMCKERIEGVAVAVEGVVSAVWSMETKLLGIEYYPVHTTPEAVSQAIAASGHDTGFHKADNTTYNALPDCCKYRE